jgi:hypothetical protein
VFSITPSGWTLLSKRIVQRLAFADSVFNHCTFSFPSLQLRHVGIGNVQGESSVGIEATDTTLAENQTLLLPEGLKPYRAN